MREGREGGKIAVRHCNRLRAGRRGGLKKGIQEKHRKKKGEKEKTKKRRKGKQAEEHRNKARKTEKNKQSPIQLTESNTNK